MSLYGNWKKEGSEGAGEGGGREGRRNVFNLKKNQQPFNHFYIQPKPRTV